MNCVEIKLEDVKDTIPCPRCGMCHKLEITLEDLSKRYTPVIVMCFDGQPQGKGCLNFFEYFICDNILVIRESK